MQKKKSCDVNSRFRIQSISSSDEYERQVWFKVRIKWKKKEKQKKRQQLDKKI
jgi:hypothetical protein